MRHAFECLAPCKRCRGTGLVGRGARRRRCKPCGGRGICNDWRGDHPPRASCRDPDCCKCGGDPCLWLGCQVCFDRVGGGGAPCREGGCQCLLEHCLKLPCAQCPDQVEEVVTEPNTRPCSAGACPRCGGLYVEWLSEKVSPEDVYLWSERRTRFPPLGSIRIKRHDPRAT